MTSKKQHNLVTRFLRIEFDRKGLILAVRSPVIAVVVVDADQQIRTKQETVTLDSTETFDFNLLSTSASTDFLFNTPKIRFLMY